MANVYHQFRARDFIPDATVGPQWASVAGTNFPVQAWKFDGAGSLDEAMYVDFRAVGYASGNLTVDVDWYADSGTSGDVVFGAAIAAITPNTDTQDIETKAFATENTVTDSHLGTTAKRLHRASITVSNLDSLAADDHVTLRIRRLGSDAADTLNSVDVHIVDVTVYYSDT